MRTCIRFAVLAALVLTACGSDEVGPVIDSLLPTAAARGASVEIVGNRFCGDASDDAKADGSCMTPPNGFVNFGEDADVTRAVVVAWTNQKITVQVPQSATVGSTLVLVIVNGVSSNAASFEVQ